MKYKRIFILALLSFVAICFSTQKAYADFDQIPTRAPEDVHQYINLTNNDVGNSADYESGQLGKRLLKSYIKVYTTSVSDEDISINFVQRGVGLQAACRKYKVVFSAGSNNRSIPVSRCAGEDGYSVKHFNVPPDAFSLAPGVSRTSDGKTVYVALVYIGYDQGCTQAADEANCDGGKHSATMGLNVSRNAAIGYAGSVSNERNIVNLYPSITNSSNGESGGTTSNPVRNHTIDFNFKPQCNDSFAIFGIDSAIHWTDLDTSRDFAIYASFTTYNETNGMESTVNLGNSDERTYSFKPHVNERYRLRFQGVDGGNGISVDLPFDTANFNLPCKKPQGDIKIPQCVNSFTIRGYNANESASNIEYRVKTGGTVVASGSIPNNPKSNYVKQDYTNFTWGNGKTATFTLELKDENGIWRSNVSDNNSAVSKTVTSTNCNNRTDDPIKVTYAAASCSDSLDIIVNDNDTDGQYHGTYIVYPVDNGGYREAGAVRSESITMDVPDGTTTATTTISPYIKVDPNNNNGWAVEIYFNNEKVNSDGVAYEDANNTPLKTVFTGANCYKASCDPVSVIGDGPGGIVIANHDFNVTYSIKNEGPGTLTSNTNSLYLSSLDSQGRRARAGDNPPGAAWSSDFTANIGNEILYQGQSVQKTVKLHAQDKISSSALWAHPTYSNFAFGAECWAKVDIYRHYNLEPQSSLEDFNDENPTSISYSGSIKNNEPITDEGVSGVAAVVTQQLYKAGASEYINRQPDDSRTFKDKGYDYGTHGAYPNPYPIVAGDKYCSDTYINYSTGYLGPNGSIVDNKDATSRDNCVPIANKPFFKSYGAGISAGGSFETSDPATSCKGGGMLAGWNNNAGIYPNYGASSQFSVVALKNVTGVASARTYFNNGRPATDLTFANRDQNGQSTAGNGSYNPILGGSYQGAGASGVACLPQTAVKDDTGALADKTNTPGRYVAPGTTTVIHVKGSTYIEGNVAYQGPWSVNASGSSNIPSFKLIADGNIYINPAVTQLDGIYQAKGNIYTCADGYAPMPASRTFDECKNQLTVNGNFVAKKVNLMRTYGSLRDETPKVTNGGTPIDFCWSENKQLASTKCPSSYNRCVDVTEPSDNQAFWGDNNICVPTNASFDLAWTHAGNHYTDPSIIYDYYAYGQSGPPPDPATFGTNYYQAYGYTCIQFDPRNAAGNPSYWDDNYLCIKPSDPNNRSGTPSNRAQLQAVIDTLIFIKPTDTRKDDSTKTCTKIYDNGDPSTETNWRAGYYLCVDKPSSVQQVVASPCSNASSAPSFTRIPTCAAEVFNYTPEYFLSGNGNLNCTNNCARQSTRQTSLPPVL